MMPKMNTLSDRDKSAIIQSTMSCTSFIHSELLGQYQVLTSWVLTSIPLALQPYGDSSWCTLVFKKHIRCVLEVSFWYRSSGKAHTTFSPWRLCLMPLSSPLFWWHTSTYYATMVVLESLRQSWELYASQCRHLWASYNKSYQWIPS